MSVLSDLLPKCHCDLHYGVVEYENHQGKGFDPWCVVFGRGNGPLGAPELAGWVGNAGKWFIEKLARASKKEDEDLKSLLWNESKYQRFWHARHMNGKVSELKGASPPLCNSENPSWNGIWTIATAIDA